jgi:hypothetical protein
VPSTPLLESDRFTSPNTIYTDLQQTMDDDTLKTTLITLFTVGCFVAFVYMSWQSRVKLRQIREFPSVLQAAGLRLFSNPNLHESYRFLPAFKHLAGTERTLYAATKRENRTDITVFVYAEKRAKGTYSTLVLTATLPYNGPTGCIFTRRTAFGPMTPEGQRVFKTNDPELDKAFRITAVSDEDFQLLATPVLQRCLLLNKDISQIEMAKRTIALFTSDNRFFQLTTINGIPSPAVFTRRLQQLQELQNIFNAQFRE